MTVCRPMIALGAVLVATGFCRAARAARLTPQVDLRLFVDLEFVQPTMNASGAHPAFRQHHANVIFEGRPADDVVVHAHVEFEYGGDVNSGTHGAPGTPLSDTGETLVEAAYAQWSPWPELRLRAGRTITPYGHYNEIHDTTPAFVATRVPDSIYRPDRLGGFLALPKQHTGIDARLEVDWLRATAFLSNGFVTNGNEARIDDNGDKGLGLRAETDPVRAISGSLTGFHSLAEQGGRAVHHWAGVASVVVGFAGLSGVAEGMIARRGPTTQWGAAAELISLSLHRLSPFARAERFVPDTDAGGAANLLTAGAKIDLVVPFLQLKVEHAITWQHGEQWGEARAAVVGWF